MYSTIAVHGKKKYFFYCQCENKVVFSSSKEELDEGSESKTTAWPVTALKN